MSVGGKSGRTNGTHRDYPPPAHPAKLKIITIFEEEKGSALDTNVSEIARVLF